MGYSHLSQFSRFSEIRKAIEGELSDIREKLLVNPEMLKRYFWEE